MQCPHCSAELKLNGEHYGNSVDFSDPSTVDGEITFTFLCDACGEELGEYEFEIELDVSSFTDQHEEEDSHTLCVELIKERFVTSIGTNMTRSVGYDCIIRVSCSCGDTADFEYEDSERQEEVTNELIDL